MMQEPQSERYMIVTRGRYGYRRITAQLRNDGMLLNHKTVQKLMVEMNLYASEDGKVVTSHIKVRSERLRPTSLTETSSCIQFNQKWATDVTEVKIKDRYIFSCPGYVQWGDNILRIISSGPGNGNEDAG